MASSPAARKSPARASRGAKAMACNAPSSRRSPRSAAQTPVVVLPPGGVEREDLRPAGQRAGRRHGAGSRTRSKVVRMTSALYNWARSATAHAIESVVTTPVTRILLPVSMLVLPRIRVIGWSSQPRHLKIRSQRVGLACRGSIAARAIHALATGRHVRMCVQHPHDVLGFRVPRPAGAGLVHPARSGSRLLPEDPLPGKPHTQVTAGPRRTPYSRRPRCGSSCPRRRSAGGPRWRSSTGC